MKRAFTLIELLVVIAIIVILMAVMLPVTRMVREQGAETVCQSNLRQVTIMLMTYCNDHDGLFPDPTYLYHSRKSLDPSDPTFRMGCRWHDARIGPGSPFLREHRELQGALIPYLGNPKILLCKTGARANMQQGCSNRSPLITYVHTTVSEHRRETVIKGTAIPHDANIPVIPQYTYAMNGNLCRAFQTASLIAPLPSNELDRRSLRERQVRKETQVTRSPSEVFAFGEENSWAVNVAGREGLGGPGHQSAAPYNLSGPWPGHMDSPSDTTDHWISSHEIPGAITLGSLDIGPSYTISGESDERLYASKVPDTSAADAFATYHRPRRGDLNTGHSYVSMLDGHVRKVTVSDQLRKSRQIQGVPASRLGPGGNLHLAWPLDIPPLTGWENQ
ncbi:MAG: type II secretion system protein [Sedimentisphaerales bacterium]|nr:type II secretion system protein [Sedimentisphaerales bacterium]